jgi:hypothetical protein
MIRRFNRIPQLQFGETQFENDFGCRMKIIRLTKGSACAFIILVQETFGASLHKVSLGVGGVGITCPGAGYR